MKFLLYCVNVAPKHLLQKLHFYSSENLLESVGKHVTGWLPWIT